MANMKFKAHQSFFIRKGWLSKGIRAVKKDGKIFVPANAKQAMDDLGLGSNQVVALRYWLVALGLIKKSTSSKGYVLTDFCEVICENDPYIEELGSLWALHYNLACNKEEATSWYCFFNEFKSKSFLKTDVASAIQKYAVLNAESGSDSAKKSVALSSIESDVDCLINTYVPHSRLGGKEVSPENVIDSPLGELHLIDVDNKALKSFRRKSAVNSSLPSLLVLYAIIEMVERRKNDDHPAWADGRDIPINEILYGPYSPGLVFGLDSVSLLDQLYELENANSLAINRTAGSDVIRLPKDCMASIEYLEKYYRTIGL